MLSPLSSQRIVYKIVLNYLESRQTRGSQILIDFISIVYKPFSIRINLFYRDYAQPHVHMYVYRVDAFLSS